jgi:hypothetical protein
MHVFRIATRLERNMRKCTGITIGILQAHVEVEWRYYRHITRTYGSTVALL